jgi:hypothetical protein
VSISSQFILFYSNSQELISPSDWSFSRKGTWSQFENYILYLIKYYLPSILFQTTLLPLHMYIKINKVGKQEVGIWWVQKCFPRYGVPIWSLWPNIRFVSSIVAEKNVTKIVQTLNNNNSCNNNFKYCFNQLYYTPAPRRGRGVYCFTSVRPRYFSSHFSQQILMTQIWYLVTSFISVPHIVGSIFGPIRFLLTKQKT